MHEDETEDQYYARMRAEFEGLRSFESTSLREYAEQPKHGFHGVIIFERAVYELWSEKASDFIINDPWGVAKSLRILEVRCPVKGCYLGDVFRFPLSDGGERFLALTNKRRGESKGGFLNWAFSDDWRGMPMYIPASCRCGSARLGTGWLLEATGVVRGWFDKELDRLPTELQRGARSGTFIPSGKAWRTKHRQ